MIADDGRDQALLAAHVAGDPDAFGELVALHRDRLYAVAVRTMAGPGPDPHEDAADAVQDALLSALRSAPGYRGEAQVTTWLHRIVVNACLDRLRRRRLRHTEPLGEQEPAVQGDPLSDHDTALDVRAALAALPDEQRVALVLVDLSGLSVAQAAEVLGVPPGTVSSRCSRGRARLAVTLGHLRRNLTTPAPVPSAEGVGSSRVRRAPDPLHLSEHHPRPSTGEPPRAGGRS